MSRLIVILEQNPVDASFMERCFLEERVCNPARVLRTPERLRCYVEGVGSYRNRELYPLPSLLLLNLDYPRAAFEVLEWLRKGNYLDSFPVFGIGNMIDEQVLQKAFDVGLNAFFEKPTEMAQLSKLICQLQWVDQPVPKIPADIGVKVLTREEFILRDQP